MAEMDYAELTSQLDAREILRYLNSMGINNISGEVLKYFITDLKKLIKYDLQTRHNGPPSYEPPGLERLHSASTFSSRTRSRNQEGNKVCYRECPKSRVHIRSSYSSPNFGQATPVEQKEENPSKRSCCCVRTDKRPETTRKESTVTTGSSNCTIDCNHLLQSVNLNIPYNYLRHPITKVFSIPAGRTILLKNSPVPRICAEYNQACASIADIDIFHDSCLGFKKKLYEYLLSK